MLPETTFGNSRGGNMAEEQSLVCWTTLYKSQSKGLPNNALPHTINCYVCERKRMWPKQRHYPSIWLEGQRRTKKNFSHDSQCACQDWKREPLKYKSEIISLQPTNMLKICIRQSNYLITKYDYTALFSQCTLKTLHAVYSKHL